MSSGRKTKLSDNRNCVTVECHTRANIYVLMCKVW